MNNSHNNQFDINNQNHDTDLPSSDKDRDIFTFEDLVEFLDEIGHDLAEEERNKKVTLQF